MSRLGHVRLQERREDEKAPDAVDDRGDARQQFDGDADRPAQPVRAEFGEENRDAEADRNGDQHGDEGGDQRAVDRRQRAEFLGDRVPVVRDKKSESERSKRRKRADDQRDDHAAEHDEHHHRRGLRSNAVKTASPSLNASKRLDALPRAMRRILAAIDRHVGHRAPLCAIAWKPSCRAARLAFAQDRIGQRSRIEGRPKPSRSTVITCA